MRRTLALLAAILMLPATLALADEADGGTSVDTLDASATAGTVAVDGTATFGGIDGIVVADIGSDGVDPELSGTLGYVIEEAIIGQPDADTGDIVLTYALQDVTSSLVPEAIQYYWDFGIRTASGRSVDFQVDGKASSAGALGSPAFRLRADCATEGNLFACAGNLGAVEAVVDLAADTVAITVPLATLETFLGESLSGARLVYVDLFGGIVAQPSGVVFNVSNIGYAMASAKTYDIASPQVTVTLTDDAGVQAGVAVLDAADGAFATTFPGVAAGDYTVTATACYGPSSCGSRTGLVTVE